MFAGIPIVSIIILLPLIGAIVSFCLGKHEKYAKYVALAFSVAALILSVLVGLEFLVNPGPTATGYHAGFTDSRGFGFFDFQFYESHPWVESLGISYIVGLDGISLPLFILTTLLSTLAILFSWDTTVRPKAYFGLMLVLEVGVLGVFSSLDYFLFYVFWEVVLIPMYFMIGVWGGPRKDYAAIKFFIYTHVASLAILIAIMAMYFQAGAHSFGMEDIARSSLVLDRFGRTFQIVAFLALFFGFGVKVPMVPFHTWLPDAHVEAPTAGSIILAGILIKMGAYGFLRFSLPFFPDATIAWTPAIMVLSVIAIIYGAYMAFAQTDFKKLIAYSSVSHMGFVTLGIFALNSQGLEGGILQMLNHGVSTGALFLAVGVIYERTHTRMIADYGGIAAKVPVYATFLLIITLSSIGLPGTNGFIGEFTILLGAFLHYKPYAVIASLGIILGAGYMLWLYQRIAFGKITNPHNEHLADMNWREVAASLPLVVLVFFIGLYPNAAFGVMHASVSNLIQHVQAKAQTVPAVAQTIGTIIGH
jgi:NADH-quinone oxidoreductase subunit M